MIKRYFQKNSSSIQWISFLSLLLIYPMMTFSASHSIDMYIIDDETGYFYADKLEWSSEFQKVYLEGNVRATLGANGIEGKGRFSFLGKVSYLVFNDEPAPMDVPINVSKGKYVVKILSKESATLKYGEKGKNGAVEINRYE